MEACHRDRLRAKFRQELRGKSIVCLHITDAYEYMDEELVRQLEMNVSPHLADVDDGMQS